KRHQVWVAIKPNGFAPRILGWCRTKRPSTDVVDNVSVSISASHKLSRTRGQANNCVRSQQLAHCWHWDIFLTYVNAMNWDSATHENSRDIHAIINECFRSWIYISNCNRNFFCKLQQPRSSNWFRSNLDNSCATRSCALSSFYDVIYGTRARDNIAA